MCREPKKHREVRHGIKKSCNVLCFNQEIDARCHVLHIFILEKFGDRLACTIQDVIQVAKTSDTYPLPLQTSCLCDLAQVLSTRLPIFFLHNKQFPEKSLLVLNIGGILGKVVGTIFGPQGFGEYPVVSSRDGVLPLSQIMLDCKLPNMDSSSVLSLLSELKLCLDISHPNILNLVRFGRVKKIRSSSCITLPESKAALSEKMPVTSSFSTEMTGAMIYQNSSRILMGSAPVPSSPRCERARESCSPPQHTAPISAVKISDQIYAMGASAGGSQPLLNSMHMSRVALNDLQKGLRQWTSFRSLHYVSVPHLTQTQGRLSTSSLESGSSSLCKYTCFGSIASLSSTAPEQDHGQNCGTNRTSLGSQIFSTEHNGPTHTSEYAPSNNICSSSTEAAKKIVPMRRHSSLVQSQQVSDKYLFFPGLVSQDQPSSGVWLYDQSFVIYSGWCLQCTDPHHFFSPRFIQTLILCLTSELVASSSKDSNTLVAGKYTVWKSGLSWLSQNGIETFVELKEDGRALIVLIRVVEGAEIRGIKLRSSLIKSIFDIKEKCCPSVPTAEYLIDPSLLQQNQEGYPIIRGKLNQLAMFDIGMIAQAMVQASCGIKG